MHRQNNSSSNSSTRPAHRPSSHSSHLRLLFASASQKTPSLRLTREVPRKSRKSTGKNRQALGEKHRIFPVRALDIFIDGKIFAIFRVLVDRQNDRFSTLVLPNGTPVAKIGEAKANQQLTRKFLVNFSCNFIRLHVTISLWSKSDQSGAQWKKTAKLSQSGRLTASLP